MKRQLNTWPVCLGTSQKVSNHNAMLKAQGFDYSNAIESGSNKSEWPFITNPPGKINKAIHKNEWPFLL